MADDWDLQAVVRGCSSSSSSSITTPSSTASFMLDSTTISHFGTQQQEQGQLFTLPYPTSTINLVEELHQLYKPFFTKFDPLSISSYTNAHSCSLSSNIQLSTNEQTQIKQQKNQQKQSQADKPSHSLSVNNPRSRKRKNQIIKKVCQVPVESLSSDIWAWRKYGQKPIKGSPYPRGYYRCSSSKGCLARKQVERNRSDPTMFIVTYTSEHNHSAPTHRNSLAGSTRQKPVTSGNSNKPSTKTSSPATSLEEDIALDPITAAESKLANLLGNEEEEDELGFSDMTVSDDFFVGLEGLAGQENEDCFFEHLPMSFTFPWVASNAATVAGGN